jgi:hypothetical protein
MWRLNNIPEPSKRKQQWWKLKNRYSDQWHRIMTL